MPTTQCRHTLHGGIVLPTPQSFSASCLATHFHLSSPFNGVSDLINAISCLVDVSFLHYWWHRWHSIDTSLTASPLPHWVRKCLHACVCVLDLLSPLVNSHQVSDSIWSGVSSLLMGFSQQLLHADSPPCLLFPFPQPVFFFKLGVCG